MAIGERLDRSPARRASASARGSKQLGVPSGAQGRSESKSSNIGASCPSCVTRPFHNFDEAASILRSIKLFAEMDPSVQAMLPKISKFISCSPGTVLFREGDGPGNCYVVLNGEVGVFAMLDEAVQESEAGSEDVPPGALTETLADYLPGSRTVDGLSHYHGHDDLGRQIAVVRPGQLLGELALLNDQQRTASVQCLTDAEFLAIRRTDFDAILKEDMLRKGDEKLCFLMRHVPGMGDVAVPKSGSRLHASYYFRKAHFQRGHTFFVQGAVADPPSIYIVFSGTVEFLRSHRREDSNRLPTSLEAVEKLMNSMKSEKLSRRTPSSQTGSCSKNDFYGLEASGIMDRRGVLIAGGVFGSLPITEPEPFTVKVCSAGSCEVLYIQGSDFGKLPRRLLDTCREYIANSTAWRLHCHRGSLDVRRAVTLMRSSSCPSTS